MQINLTTPNNLNISSTLDGRYSCRCNSSQKTNFLETLPLYGKLLLVDEPKVVWNFKYTATREFYINKRQNKGKTSFRLYLVQLSRYGCTYSSTQCPAVAIQFSFKMAPPHLWVLEKPKKEVLLTETLKQTLYSKLDSWKLRF